MWTEPNVTEGRRLHSGGANSQKCNQRTRNHFSARCSAAPPAGWAIRLCQRPHKQTPRGSAPPRGYLRSAVEVIHLEKRVYNVKKTTKRNKKTCYITMQRAKARCTLHLYRYDRIEIGWMDGQADGWNFEWIDGCNTWSYGVVFKGLGNYMIGILLHPNV